MIAPCRGCEERNAECHSHCERYAEFAAECAKKRNARQLECVTREPSPALARAMRKLEYNRKRRRARNKG